VKEIFARGDETQGKRLLEESYRRDFNNSCTFFIIGFLFGIKLIRGSAFF
jgi:hypothetical protein